MARAATDSVEYRHGKWYGRVTGANGQRVRMPLGTWPNSPEGRERAQEAAAGRTERLCERQLGGVPKGEQRADSSSEAQSWWNDYFEHRDGLGMKSVTGIYNTHIKPVVDAAWPGVTRADCERLRDALDARVQSGSMSAKTAFNAWTVFRTASKASAGR